MVVERHEALVDEPDETVQAEAVGVARQVVRAHLVHRQGDDESGLGVLPLPLLCGGEEGKHEEAEGQEPGQSGGHGEVVDRP